MKMDGKNVTEEKKKEHRERGCYYSWSSEWKRLFHFLVGNKRPWEEVGHVHRDAIDCSPLIKDNENLCIWIQQ